MDKAFMISKSVHNRVVTWAGHDRTMVWWGDQNRLSMENHQGWRGLYGKVNQSAPRKPSAQQSLSSSLALPRQTFRNSLQPYWQQQQQQQQASLSQDPNMMDIDRSQVQRPPIKCYNCNKKGHMAWDGKSQRSIRVMTQKKIWDACKYLNEQEAVAKDATEIRKKEDFSTVTQWSRFHWSYKISFIN